MTAIVEIIPDWARWKAVSDDGLIMYFQDKPVLRPHGWIPRGPVREYGIFGHEDKPERPYCIQVEQKALRSMQHPDRIRLMKEVK